MTSSAAGSRCSAPWARATRRAWRSSRPRCIASQPPLVADAREYLMLSAMTGYVASGDKAKALALWESHGQGTRAQRPAFRLLRCHAEPKSCAAAFRTYAERY